MNKLLQNKMALIGIGAVVVVVGVALLMFVQNTKKAKEATGPEPTVEEEAVSMKPEEIGLELTPNKDNTEVNMKISDVSKFTAFDYEMSYDAEVDGEVVPRGALGSGEVEAGESSISRDITIGTCSAGKCKYDKGVTKISFTIKLTLKDGKTALVKKDLDLSAE